MTIDPFEQLRIPAQPVRPDARFVVGLRARIVAALDADPSPPGALPIIDLPERTTTMTDTYTSTTIKPYLCASPAVEAMAWYADVLGAVETIRYTGDDGRIGHAELAVGGASFMLSDEYPEIGVTAPTTLGGSAVTLHLEVPDVDAVYARAVDRGGQAAGEPANQDYGARSFSMVDPFGHRWMVQTPMVAPPDQVVRAASDGFTITTPDGASVATGTEPEVVELGYVTLAWPDTERASRFYGELFGWQTETGNAGEGYAHVHNTKLPIGMTPGRVDDGPELYFRVDDIVAMVARVSELGGVVDHETTDDSGPNAACRDDQGRRFQLWQPAPGYE